MINQIWRKKYRKLFFWTWVVGIILIIFSDYIIGAIILIENITFGEKINSILIFSTGIVILWYTRETFDLKVISQKSLKETREQTGYTRRPFLRLQWKNKGYMQNMLSANPAWDSNLVTQRMKAFTSIELINNGQGLAKNIVIIECSIDGEGVKLKNAPVIRALDGATQLVYDEDSRMLDEVIPNSEIGIIVEYQDIANDLYRVEFKSNNEFNDGFEIISQEKIDNS